MSDEPRRSVRATKGQHKTLDALDQPTEMAPKKGRGKRGTAKKTESQEPASAAEEEEIIRCICGAVEQDDDADEKWISCEKCNAWQHNVCMGVTVDEKELETLEYFCEECRPEEHQKTLKAIAKGEKPWEERQRVYEESQSQTKGKKKKGKGKRMSDPKTEVESNGKANSPVVTEAIKEKKDGAGRAGSVKRKARDDSHEDTQAKTKVRKVSTPGSQAAATLTPSDIPATINELPSKRKGVANFVLKNLKTAMLVAKEKGVFKGSEPELDARAMRLALEIERATFDTAIDYVDQGRKLASNLKTNQDLCDRLLLKKLTPATFAAMTVEEMASKELQKQISEMKARADKQSILISDDGPRIRRTHKGDEVIEDGSAATIDDMPSVRRRSMMDPNGDMASRSRENSIGDGGDELPQDIDDYRSRDDIRGNAEPSGPLSLNTSGSPPPVRKQSTQPSNFDINKIYSSVQSPTTAQHTRKPSTPMIAKEGTTEDADIDRMLDDGNESPPYSPAEHDPDPSIVWRGHMHMTTVATFSAVGRHIAGADLGAIDPKVSYSELIPPKLAVAGRIEEEKANEYLCSLRYSGPSDIVIVALSPSGAGSQEDFISLYEYFSSRKKYGVVGNKSFANVRDTYLVPVVPGNGPIPEFMLNLENNNLPQERAEPMILVTLVVRSERSQGTPIQGTPYQQQPGIPQRQMSMSGPSGPAMSPINQQGAFPSPGGSAPSQHSQPLPQHYQNQGHPPPNRTGQPPNHQAYSLSPEQQAARAQQLDAQSKGEAVARRIMGGLINAPTVAFLLPQAHIMQQSEWAIIKEILEKDAQAREDLPYLSKLLEQKGTHDRNAQSQAQQQPPTHQPQLQK